MENSTKIIVITGAESTGKSTLTKALANYFDVPYIPEIAREYVENLKHHYTYYDLEIIAKGQIEKYNLLTISNPRYLFIDTWLINTKVWFEEVYKKTPEWLLKALQEIEIDLYLVCDIDLPWVFDPVRENGGENRIRLQKKYLQNIQQLNSEFKIVSGKNEQRIQVALESLKLLK